ncbi:MAG: hypothetical protein IPM25_15615 [Chloracidobacterium sp.]|nr:hypothetical protein [Chloracidobacterium sp.]
MAEEITAAQLSSYLHFVASDAMGGRDTPSMGLDITAEFIRMNLEKWGFKGAGDNGSFFQKIELSSETRNAANTSLRVGTKSFVLNTDFYRVEGSTEASGQLVFGKDGWMIKSKGMDSLSGIDVTGKIVVFVTPNSEQRSFTPRPPGITDDDVKGTKGVDWADPVTNAVAKGAAGVIIVSNPAIQGLWPQLRGILGRGASGPTKLRQEAAGGPDPSCAGLKSGWRRVVRGRICEP